MCFQVLLFALGDIYQDAGVLRDAAEDVKELLERDPGLQQEELFSPGFILPFKTPIGILPLK